MNLVNYIYYPGTDRLKTVGIITYYYDENGNITGLSSGTSIEYNYRDMPTKITESGGTIYTFSYNGDGLRVKKHRQDGGDSEAQPNENYYFIHDENGNVLCDIDKEGNIKASYVYANGKHITKIDGGNRYYYHLDPVGSPLVITWQNEDSDTPEVVKKYKYRAFGELKYESGIYYDNHKFTGKEEDGTGLYYFGARYYDKSLGRWITPDPALSRTPPAKYFGNPQSLNPYVYCCNNPLRNIDIEGWAMIKIPEERIRFSTPWDRNYQLTSHEITLTNFFPLETFGARLLGRIASQKAQKLYPETEQSQKQDAFRHAYWAALMTKYLGIDRAKTFLKAHETFKGNRPGEQAKDEKNNKIGIGIGSNPTLETREDIVKEIKEKEHLLQIEPSDTPKKDSETKLHREGNPE